MPPGNRSAVHGVSSLLGADVPSRLGEWHDPSLTPSPDDASSRKGGQPNGSPLPLLNPLAPHARAHTPTSQLL